MDLILPVLSTKKTVKLRINYPIEHDAQLLGALMTKAQAEFDQHVVPACPEQLTANQLQATGWQETGRIYNDAGAIWRLKKDAATEYEILLPLQHDLGDYAERINDILKTLSAVEKRSQVDILSEFITNYPNFTVLGVVMQIATPSIDKLSGEITLLCTIFEKLQSIKTELADHDYILAIKAYQSRLPIRCTGDKRQS